MKNIIFALITLIININCSAQQVYPLKTDYTEISINSYLKDLNNELLPFVGIWKSSYNGNIIELYATKEDHKFFERGMSKYYKDVITIKYIVKNSSGIILQNTQSMVTQQNQIIHTIYSLWSDDNGSKLELYYGGTNCGIGWGRIILKKISPTQISWEYSPNSTILRDDCPANTDKTVYLPVTKDLIFTKQ